MPHKNKDAEYLRELADPRIGICGPGNPNVDADRIRRIADRIEAQSTPDRKTHNTEDKL